MEISFIHMKLLFNLRGNKINFHIKGFALDSLSNSRERQHSNRLWLEMAAKIPMAAMLDEQTIEANEESFVIGLQHGGNHIMWKRPIKDTGWDRKAWLSFLKLQVSDLELKHHLPLLLSSLRDKRAWKNASKERKGIFSYYYSYTYSYNYYYQNYSRRK